MPTLGQLRQSAKGLGIPSSEIRGATSADELQALIVDFMNGGSSTTKTTRKPTTKTRTATKTATKPVRRGRPPKATTTAVKSKPAAKSTTGKAKRSTADDSDSGRMTLGAVDYSNTDGWNAREGSPPDLIVKSLRKYRGNRTKVFTALLPKIWDFVGKKMQDGTTRTKASAEDMLRYRISRTAWDFAMKTGQHEKSTNRAEYGTGGTGDGSYKPKKAAGAARTGTKSKTTTTKAKTTARPQKAAQKPAEAPKRRGRPPGSKNKPKTATTTATAKKPVAKKKTARR